MINQHKIQLLQLIGDSKTEAVLKKLDSILIHGRLYADLVAYKSRFRELNASHQQNLISFDEFHRESSKFNKGLISFVNEIDERELLNQILLLSPNKIAHDKIANSFKLYFPNTEEHWDGNILKNDYAFVVCNDFYTPKEEQEEFDKLMKSYMEVPNYLVCATENNRKELVGENRDKVHAANSKFALYARVREMIDFVRYFN
jgi:Effector-associated domain 11